MGFYLFLFIIVVFLLLCLLLFRGFFFPVKVKNSLIGPFNLVYRDFQGNFNELDQMLLDFHKDLSKYFQPIAKMKIYYDNPLAVNNRKATRAIYGLILGEKEPLERIQKFCKRFEDIRFTLLCKITCVHTTVPQQKQYEMNQKVFQYKILPQLVVALGNNVKKDQNEICLAGLVEITNLDNTDNKKFIKYAIPYGNDTNNYFLTNYPDPEYT